MLPKHFTILEVLDTNFHMSQTLQQPPAWNNVACPLLRLVFHVELAGYATNLPG